jgi:hypothetical protein
MSGVNKAKEVRNNLETTVAALGEHGDSADEEGTTLGARMLTGLLKTVHEELYADQQRLNRGKQLLLDNDAVKELVKSNSALLPTYRSVKDPLALENDHALLTADGQRLKAKRDAAIVGAMRGLFEQLEEEPESPSARAVHRFCLAKFWR